MKKVKRSSNIWLKVIGLVTLLLVLIGASVSVTLMAIGTFDVKSVVTNKNAKPVDDIFEAEKICRAQILLDHGDSLHFINTDERSGRYDKNDGEYRVFYQLDIYRDATKRTGVNVFYSNCYISSVDGSVARMEYLQQEDGGSEVSKRDDTNSIGL